ncbi:phosphate acyltransferase PlsX [soil metagenome]
MNIALDMMGGDFAPLEALNGVELYLSKHQAGHHIQMIGDQEKLDKLVEDKNFESSNASIIPSTQVIEMHEHPTKALREKQQSSIAIGFHLLATGKADAFISAGNTGAMMVGALYSIKAIEGVARPTIGAYLPRENGELALLLDVGLNADCKPDNLLQFGILGSLFAKHILKFENPRVGLINLGAEEGKGDILTQSAYKLLKENSQINFAGNVEGRDLLTDKADVFVCDGFTGNVLLKFAESIYDIVVKRNIHDTYFDRFNFEMYGGVPVLGVNKPVIIGHGISHAHAFANMIDMAIRMEEADLSGKIRSSFNS